MMNNLEPPEELKAFRTLKGFIRGEEAEEETYFCYCASLRIHGEGVPFEEISHRLGVLPTNMHRKGERRHSESAHVYQDDAWQFRSDTSETEPLERHIVSLWRVVQPEVEYLKSLKGKFRVDVFCGYRSNCDHAGFEVSHEALEMFTALQVPFSVSIIVVSEDVLRNWRSSCSEGARRFRSLNEGLQTR